MIVAKNIHKTFDDLQVLKGIDLHIKKKEIVAIVGPSGAGKTTLLQILGTLDKADENAFIQINGQEILKLKDKKLAHFRNTHIGFIFQFHQLLPEFTALENVCIPGFIANKPKNDVINDAKEILEYLKLSDRLSHHPNELSGGEQQRVAVARALINKPSVIFADEPTGNLDHKTAERVYELMLELHKELGTSFVVVTHDQTLAARMDRILTIEDGVLITTG